MPPVHPPHNRRVQYDFTQPSLRCEKRNSGTLHTTKQSKHSIRYSNKAKAKHPAIATTTPAGTCKPPKSKLLPAAEPRVLVTAPVKPSVSSVLAAPDVVLAVTRLVAFAVVATLELHAEVDSGAYVSPGMLKVEMLM